MLKHRDESAHLQPLAPLTVARAHNHFLPVRLPTWGLGREEASDNVAQELGKQRPPPSVRQEERCDSLMSRGWILKHVFVETLGGGSYENAYLHTDQCRALVLLRSREPCSHYFNGKNVFNVQRNNSRLYVWSCQHIKIGTQSKMLRSGFWISSKSFLSSFSVTMKLHLTSF